MRCARLIGVQLSVLSDRYLVIGEEILAATRRRNTVIPHRGYVNVARGSFRSNRIQVRLFYLHGKTHFIFGTLHEVRESYICPLADLVCSLPDNLNLNGLTLFLP